MLARSALFWLYFIQIKHCRLDRIRVELRHWPFWQLFLSRHRVIVLILFIDLGILELLYYANIIDAILINYIGLFAWLWPALVYLIIYMISTIFALLTRALRIPKFTKKITALFVSILFIEFFLAGSALMSIDYLADPTAMLIIEFFSIEFLQPFLVLGIFTLAYTPNIFLHRYFISRARKKIAAHNNLIVIGITGSYGKTSTKEYLAHILSKKYKVLKTPAHINVDTGVAKVILRDLKPEHEIFIVEMGAYKKGEIGKICDLVRPQFAVITGLSDQHLELFGSLAAIADAKFELVDTVRQSNRIFANADSESLLFEFKRRRIMPIWYGVRAHAIRFKPADVVYSETGTSFALHGIKFRTPTVGTAALNNLLGAITAAVELKMHLEEIAPLVSDLPKISGTMELKHGINGVLIIDDTYNANTEGVLAALQDLQHFNRAKKIFIFREVIELGEHAKKDHAQIAKTATHTADYALFLSSSQYKIIYATIVEEGMEASRILGANDMERLQALCGTETVVLCEGRDAQKIMKQLL